MYVEILESTEKKQSLTGEIRSALFEIEVGTEFKKTTAAEFTQFGNLGYRPYDQVRDEAYSYAFELAEVLGCEVVGAKFKKKVVVIETWEPIEPK